MHKCNRCSVCGIRTETITGYCGCTIRPTDPTPAELAAIEGEPQVDDSQGDDDREIQQRLDTPDPVYDPLVGIVRNGCVEPCPDCFFVKKYSEPDGKAEPKRFGRIAEMPTVAEIHRKGNHISDR